MERQYIPYEIENIADGFCILFSIIYLKWLNKNERRKGKGFWAQKGRDEVWGFILKLLKFDKLLSKIIY